MPSASMAKGGGVCVVGLAGRLLKGLGLGKRDKLALFGTPFQTYVFSF